MPVMSATSLPKTPFDYVAEGYWQDFLAKRPIAGGIAYEAELYNCQLDESLLSLQRVDTLLTQMRRDMSKAGIWNETALLANERYRNLLVFLAFYAGRVLAQQWQSTAHWYGQFELRARYPELALITDDFYQHMAVLYDDSVSNEMQANDISRKIMPVFFALEPIGLRLFGHIDRQFEAVEGGQVASGLYQAVSARLPNLTTGSISTISTTRSVPNASVPLNSDTSVDSAQPVELAKVSEDNVLSETSRNFIPKIATAKTETTLDSHANTTLKSMVSTVDNNITVATAQIVEDKADSRLAHSEAQTISNLSKPMLSKDLPSSNVSASVSKKRQLPVVPSTPEIFTQLLTELDDIEVVQTAGNAEYQQARKTLDQFEQHIAKQHKPRAQVVFSESHQTAKQQALVMMKSSADQGNTAAMLRLGMYELLGEGLLTGNSVDTADNKDTNASKDASVEWIKQAANKKDSRAQCLLSKMYYQGIGVPQDINNGKHWLEQAAENGHAEAASLVGQWQQAQVLITTRQQEQHSIKRYQLLIGVVIIGALLLIIFV